MDSEIRRKLFAAIEAVETKKKSQYEDVVCELFEVMIKKLRSGATQKEIVRALNEEGVAISTATFRKLFENECDSRDIKIDKAKKGMARYSA